MTRYDELDAANKRRWAAFDRYEEDCRNFIRRLHRELIGYLGCSGQEVEWVTFTGGEDEQVLKHKGIVELTADKRMILHTNAFYRFVLRLHFGLRLIDLPFKIKKVGSYFTIQLGEDEAFQPDETRMEAVAEYVYDKMMGYFETEFEDFVQGRESDLGFPLPHRACQDKPAQL